MLSPRMLRRVVRGLNAFLGNYDSGGPGACAKDLQQSCDASPSYSADSRAGDELVVARYRYDLENRTFEIVRPHR